MASHLLSGFTNLLTPEAIGLLFAGMCIGMFMGMLPGLGVSLALSLMLPFLYHMSVVPAVALMLGAQAGSYYAASITAILLNTPGAPESFPTTLDGFPMAQQGEAGKALAISATSTLLGGWVGCAVLVGLLQVAGQLIDVFHPPEFVTIIVLALVLIGGTGESARASKVVVAGAVGFMAAFVGSDPVTGVERFTFGLPSLFNGVNVVPFALGVFALTQMVVMYGRKESVARTDSVALAQQFRRQVPGGVREALRHWSDILRSSVVAAVLGLIPGIGGFTANFISYSLGRQVSRERRRFGTGTPAGLVSAEGSSLAKEVGSLVPAVALGLPSGVGMVIFIAALSILGVQPGATLLRTQPSLPYTMMWVMAVAGLVSCGLGLAITPWISKITAVRGPLLFPFILVLSVLGSFAAVTNFSGVVELAVFAVIGVVMRKLNYSLAAMTIGLVLGNTFASNVHLTGSIYGWDFFFRSPLADVFLAVAIALLVLIALRGRRERSAPPAQGASGRADADDLHPVLEPVADTVLLAVGVAYTVVALGYPASAGLLPAIVSALTSGLVAYRLAGWARQRRRSRRLRSQSPFQFAAPATPAPLSSADILPATAGVSLGGAAARPSGDGGAATPGTGVISPGDASWGPPSRPAVVGTLREPTAVAARKRRWREVLALAWMFLAVLATYLLGFELGIVVVVAAYCLLGVDWRRHSARWLFAVGTTAVAFAIAYGFVSLFHLTFSGALVNA
jgi:putative tricarboxylic transport membrane protein